MTGSVRPEVGRGAPRLKPKEMTMARLIKTQAAMLSAFAGAALFGVTPSWAQAGGGAGGSQNGGTSGRSGVSGQNATQGGVNGNTGNPNQGFNNNGNYNGALYTQPYNNGYYNQG